MIPELVERFNANRAHIEAKLTKHPDDYSELVRWVVEAIAAGDGNEQPDPERIHEIDDGDYQGTLLYVIGATGYQPSTYWSVAVSYGSCSGCDTLEAIRGYGDAVSAEQVAEYMTLALHIVQGLRLISSWQLEDDTPVHA